MTYLRTVQMSLTMVLLTECAGSRFAPAQEAPEALRFNRVTNTQVAETPLGAARYGFKPLLTRVARAAFPRGTHCDSPGASTKADPR